MASRMFGLTNNASTPLLSSPKAHKMTLSAEANWSQLRRSTSDGAMPEYDPSAPFALSPKQKHDEHRRQWSDELSAIAGSPPTRHRSGLIGLTPPPVSPQKAIP